MSGIYSKKMTKSWFIFNVLIYFFFNLDSEEEKTIRLIEEEDEEKTSEKKKIGKGIFNIFSTFFPKI